MSPAINIPQNPRSSGSSLHFLSTSPSVYSSCSCSSCDDTSLPLNTPFSTPPTTPPATSTSNTPRRRRNSIPIVNMNPTPHSRSISVESPVVMQRYVNASSPTRAYHRSQAIITPSHSTSSRRHDREYHYRSASRSYASSPQHASSSIASGRTHFPKKLISKSAATQLSYSYTIDSERGITIPQALSQPQIDELIQLTKDIRKRRHEGKKDKKAVTFFEKTIVHEVPPAPSPPLSEAENDRRRKPVILVPASSRTDHRRESKLYYNHAPPKFEPLNPPGPSTPQAVMEKGEEFPIWRGRSRSNSSSRKEKSSTLGGRLGMKFGRNHRGEVVIIRD